MSGTPPSAGAAADTTSPEPRGAASWSSSPAASNKSSSTTSSDTAALRELGVLAAWSVTSAKPGNGVELLRDGSTDTYWQSDGIQPHLVNIQFNRRVAVQEVHLYLDYKSDESYTPSRLSVRAGSAYHDLKDVCIVELKEPSGWVIIPLSQGGSRAAGDRQVHAFFYQVAVLTNHQNGRDTHIRQILLYGGPSAQAGSSAQGQLSTLESSMFATLR